MHLLMLLTGFAGGGLCLAVRLPGPVRCWGAHAVALAVMPLMAVGCAPTAMRATAVAVAAACVWTALAGAPGGRAAGAVDLASMALITACASARTQSAVPMAMPMRMGTGMGAGSPGLGAMFALFLVGCWAVARTGVRLVPLLGGPASVRAAGGVGGRVALLGELGSGAMIVSMAAMLV
jgi:hypothetical protein